MRRTERSYCELCGYKSIIIIIILDTTNIADYIHLKNIYSNDRFPTHIDEEHSHSIPFGRFSAPIAIPVDRVREYVLYAFVCICSLYALKLSCHV